MTTPDAHSLFHFIATTLQQETPDQSSRAVIEVSSLLDHIATMRGIDPETNGDEFNALCDQMEEDAAREALLKSVLDDLGGNQ
jgi:hypothetical protein